MKISELVAALVDIHNKYGDLRVYANAEAKGNTLKLKPENVRAGSACAFFDNKEIEDDSDIICYIGD